MYMQYYCCMVVVYSVFLYSFRALTLLMATGKPFSLWKTFSLTWSNSGKVDTVESSESGIFSV